MSALSGFIAISPCSGYIRPLSSVFVGVLGSVICFLAVKFERNKFDGSFCVFSIHGIGGFAGTLLAGLFADSTVNGVNGDLGQFIHNGAHCSQKSQTGRISFRLFIR